MLAGFRARDSSLSPICSSAWFAVQGPAMLRTSFMPQVKKRGESYLPVGHWWHGWVLVAPGHVRSVRVTFSHHDRKLGLLLSFRERHGNPWLCQVVTRSLINFPGPTPGLRFLLPHKEWPHTAWIKCSSDCWAVHNKPAQAVSLAPVIVSQACKKGGLSVF